MSKLGERLLAAPPWGRVALSEGAEAGSAVVVTTIVGAPGADLEGANGLLRRWLTFVDPAIPTILRGGMSGDALELRRQAVAGSTLAELVDRHGALSERQCAALFVDVVTCVRRCHACRLVVGALHAEALYVCPPGLDGVAALRCHGAGLALLVAAARGGVGAAGSEGARALMGPPNAVPPEVNAGRLPAATSDAWSLAAAMAHALLGAAVFSADDVAMLQHAQRQGLPAAQARQLTRVAPQLAPGLLQALSPTPLLRAGALDALETACHALDGGRASVRDDGGPWQRGSALMALGAYASARPFGDRFALRASPIVAATTDAPDEGETDRARLNAALQKLDVQRKLSQRQHVRKEQTGLKFAVVVLTAAIAAAIVWFGSRVRPQLRAHDDVAPAAMRLQRAAPPRPIKSIPLFQKGDGPARPGDS